MKANSDSDSWSSNVAYTKYAYKEEKYASLWMDETPLEDTNVVPSEGAAMASQAKLHNVHPATCEPVYGDTLCGPYCLKGLGFGKLYTTHECTCTMTEGKLKNLLYDWYYMLKYYTRIGDDCQAEWYNQGLIPVRREMYRRGMLVHEM